MTTLVEQILQLSRLESGQLEVHFDTLSLGEVLARVERQFAHISAERGVQLALDRDSELECVADPELLAQAIGNLTSNALRHTPAGGSVEVRASRVSTPAGPGGIRITVTDTGEGMDAAELERIFDRFYRSAVRSAQHDGRHFGLGLAIVQEIVSRHRGRISVQSAPHLGTTFTIDLPQDPRAASAQTA
jgi:signal transduction histidine kinase